MGPIRKFLMGAGLFTLASTSFARESIIDKFKGVLDEAKKKTSQKLKQTKEKEEDAKKKLSDAIKRATNFTKGKSLQDIVSYKNKAEKEASIVVVRNLKTYDTENKYWVSFDEVFKEAAKNARIGGDFGKDPVRVTAELLYNPNEALNRFKLFDDGFGNYMTLDEVVVYINNQVKSTTKEQIHSGLNSNRYIKRERLEEESSSLEVIINKEFILRRSNDWRITESFNFGNKIITISTREEEEGWGSWSTRLRDGSVEHSTKHVAPLSIGISCEGEGNRAAFDNFSLSMDKDTYGNRPERGYKFLIYSSGNDNIELIIQDYDVRIISTFEKFNANPKRTMVLDSLQFRVYGYKVEPYPVLRKISKNDVEYSLLIRIKENPGSRIKDIIKSTGELGIMSDLLDRGQIQLEGKKLYLKE